MKTQIHILLGLSLILALNAAPATQYPPADHGGADVVLSEGDVIWGPHTDVNHFIVLSTSTVTIRPYYPDIPGSGGLEVHANSILVQGILDASGSGYTGGGGLGGNGGDAFRCFFTQGHPEDGTPGLDGINRYGGLNPDGPYAGPNTSYPKGDDGGYNDFKVNNDLTTDTSLLMGSGGAGARGGLSGTARFPPTYCSFGPMGGGGGGGGGSGGGMISLYGNDISVTGHVLCRGVLGENGENGHFAEFWDHTDCCSWSGGDGGEGGNGDLVSATRPTEGWGGYAERPGGAGGAGAGGGLLLYCDSSTTLTVTGVLDCRGGRDQLANGGTIKIFYHSNVDISDADIHTPRLFLRNLDAPFIKDPLWFIY